MAGQQFPSATSTVSDLNLTVLKEHARLSAGWVDLRLLGALARPTHRFPYTVLKEAHSESPALPRPGLPQMATVLPSPCGVLGRLLGTPLGMPRIRSEPGN
jgi:hypothetical protein